MKRLAVFWVSCLFFVSALHAAPPPHDEGEVQDNSVPADAKPTETEKPDKPASSHATKFDLDLKIVGGVPEAPIRDADVSVKGADGVDLCDPKRSDKTGLVRFQALDRADIRLLIVSTNWKTLKRPYRLEKAHETLKVTLKPLGN